MIDAGPRHVIAPRNGTRLVDTDADGDLDILSIGWNNPTVWLYENLAVPEEWTRTPGCGLVDSRERRAPARSAFAWMAGDAAGPG